MPTLISICNFFKKYSSFTYLPEENPIIISCIIRHQSERVWRDFGKKFSPVTTLFPILFSKAILASLAILPPFIAGILFVSVLRDAYLTAYNGKCLIS